MLPSLVSGRRKPAWKIWRPLFQEKKHEAQVHYEAKLDNVNFSNPVHADCRPATNADYEKLSSKHAGSLVAAEV
jgi:hypothetical protein